MEIDFKIEKGLTLPRTAIDTAIAKVWQIQPAEIYQRTRRRGIVEPRQVVFHYRVKKLGVAPSTVERETKFDHATIIYSCRMAANLLQTDPLFKMKYERFLNEL